LKVRTKPVYTARLQKAVLDRAQESPNRTSAGEVQKPFRRKRVTSNFDVKCCTTEDVDPLKTQTSQLTAKVSILRVPAIRKKTKPTTAPRSRTVSTFNPAGVKLVKLERGFTFLRPSTRTAIVDWLN
jgi:hypothetical protein